MSFISRDIAGARAAAPAIFGMTASRRRYVRDNFVTLDRATYDAAGAFLVGELERLDPEIHEPLVSVTWHRDIDLRTDVTMGDTSSSFSVSTFGSVGGTAPAGISWATLQATARPRSIVNIGKPVVTPLTPWSQDVAYTVMDLASAQQLGRPIDAQQVSGLNLKHQMDIDQLVYIGDSSIGATGLLNSALVTNTGNVVNGASSSALWSSKTPDEILADINDLLVSVWSSSGYVAPPSKLGIAPVPFGYISTVKVSSAGNETILSYLKTRNILTATTGKELDIVSMKWLDKANFPSATTDRMAAYSQDRKYVRFPMVPLVSAPVQYEGVWVRVPYYGKLGQVEVVYPETIGVRAGIR
jgi:hypothetical protein